MNKRILGGLAVAAMLAGGLAITSGTATAVVEDREGPQVCYEQIPQFQYSRTVTTSALKEVFHQSYSYVKTVQDYETQHFFAKYTRIKTQTYNEGIPGVPAVPAVDGTWQNFSTNDENGPFEGPPEHPDDARGTWSKAKKLPPGHAGPDGVYSTSDGTGNGSWFYRAAGTPGIPAIPGVPGGWSDWSAYGPWTQLFDGGGNPTRTSWEDGTAPLGSPAGFGEGTGAPEADPGVRWYRQWQAQDTGITRQVTDGTHEEISGEVKVPLGEPWVPLDGYPKKVVTVVGVPAFDTRYYLSDKDDTSELSDANWTANEAPGEQWTQIDDRDVDGERIPCKEQPKNYTTDREVAEPCTEIGQTKTPVTVYAQEWTYELNGDFEWVAEKVGEERIEETYDRDLTAEEQAKCPVEETTTTTTPPETTVPTTTPPVTTVPPTTPTTTTVPPTTTTTTTTTVPPTTTTEVVVALPPPQPPAAVVAALPPIQAPTTTAPAPVATIPAAGLPATGSNGTGVAALIALLVTSLGGAALLAARRRNVTT